MAAAFSKRVRRSGSILCGASILLSSCLVVWHQQEVAGFSLVVDLQRDGRVDPPEEKEDDFLIRPEGVGNASDVVCKDEVEEHKKAIMAVLFGCHKMRPVEDGGLQQDEGAKKGQEMASLCESYSKGGCDADVCQSFCEKMEASDPAYLACKCKHWGDAESFRDYKIQAGEESGPPPPSAFQCGSTGNQVTHTAYDVEFAVTPAPSESVLILGALSRNGGHPAVAQIVQQSTSGFQVKVQEPEECFDGAHMAEEVDWLTDKVGVHKTDEGVPYVVGIAELDPEAEQEVNLIDFPADANFGTDDIVVILTPQVSIMAPTEWMALRIESVSSTGFQFLDQVATKRAARAKDRKLRHHSVRERIGYLAIPAGAGAIQQKPYVAGTTGRDVNHQWHEINLKQTLTDPLVFGQIKTNFGKDTSTLRIKRVRGDAGSISVTVHETQKKCGWNPWHTKEEVSYFVLGQ